jgi:hypothetical protein
LAVAFAPQTQPAIADTQQAGASRLNDLDPAAGAHAEFSHPANPAGFAVNVVNFSPLAGPKHFERQ